MSASFGGHHHALDALSCPCFLGLENARLTLACCRLHDSGPVDTFNDSFLFTIKHCYRDQHIVCVHVAVSSFCFTLSIIYLVQVNQIYRACYCVIPVASSDMGTSVSEGEVIQSVRENLFFKPSKTILATEALLESFFKYTLKHRYRLYLSGSAKHGVSCINSDVDWMVLVFEQHRHTITLDKLHSEFCRFLSRINYQPLITAIPERKVRIVTAAHSEPTRDVFVDFTFVLATGSVEGIDDAPSINGYLCDEISASMYNFWRVTDAVYKVLEIKFTRAEQEHLKTLIILIKSFLESDIHPLPHVRMVSGKCHYLGGIHVVTMVISVAMQLKQNHFRSKDVSLVAVTKELLKIWTTIDNGKKSFCILDSECEKCRSHRLSNDFSATRIRICEPYRGNDLAADIAPVLWDRVLPCWALLFEKEWRECLSGKRSLQEFIMHVPQLSSHMLGYDYIAVFEGKEATESDRRALGTCIAGLNPVGIALPRTDLLPAIACQTEEDCCHCVVNVKKYMNNLLNRSVVAEIYRYDSIP